MKFIIYKKEDVFNNKHLNNGKEYEAKDLDDLFKILGKEKVAINDIKIADKATGYFIF